MSNVDVEFEPNSGPCLMLDIVSEVVFPLSPLAFVRAQGSIKRLKERAEKSIFIDTEGLIFRVSNVKSYDTKMLDWFRELTQRPVGIKTYFTIIEEDWDALRPKIVRALERLSEDPEENWNPGRMNREDLLLKVLETKNAKELMMVLAPFPPEEDCLDLL